MKDEGHQIHAGDVGLWNSPITVAQTASDTTVICIVGHALSRTTDVHRFT